MKYAVVGRTRPTIGGLPDVYARGLSFDDAIAKADELDPDHSAKLYVLGEAALAAEARAVEVALREQLARCR